MTSDTDLAKLLAEAADSIPTPDGIAAILEAAAESGRTEHVTRASLQRRFRSRRVVLSALGAAAVVALVVAVVVSPSPTPPVAYHDVASPPVLGLNAAAPSAEAKSASEPAARAAAGTSGTTTGVANSQKIITTGTLSLRVPAARLSATVAKVNAIAASLNGYVTSSSVALAGTNRGGTIVLGVPAAAFNAAVHDAEALGTVKHLGTSADNVTGKVADLGAQLDALEAARTQLEALLARAGTVAALLSVENEITATQSQIEQLQAEQRVLANEIDYSSLSVTITPPPAHGTAARTGFSKAWHDAITHFVNGLSAFVADSGVVLFALLLVAVLAVIVALLAKMGWLILRRRRL